MGNHGISSWVPGASLPDPVNAFERERLLCGLDLDKSNDYCPGNVAPQSEPV